MKLARAEIAGRATTVVLKEEGVCSLEPLFGSGDLSRSLDAIVRSDSDILEEIAGFATAAPSIARLDQVRLLAPLTSPRKIVAIGSNYPRPSDEAASGKEPPVLFFKPSTSLCGPYDPIVLPPETDLVVGEVELAIIIGKDGDRVSAHEVMGHVFGMMVANDVTAPKVLLGESDRNPLLLQQSRGKGFRTFCPTGPWITTIAQNKVLRSMPIEQRVDDHLEMRGRTSQMLVHVATLLADISAAFGLEAGDIVLTGSPLPLSGERTPLRAGATLYSAIGKLGEMANPVVRLTDL